MALKRSTLHCIGCIALQWHSKWPSQPHLPGIWSEIFQAVLPAQERGFFGLPEVHGLMFAPLVKDMGSGNRPPSIYISPWWGLVDPWFLWFQHIPPLHHHFASPARIADWKEKTPHPSPATYPSVSSALSAFPMLVVVSKGHWPRPTPSFTADAAKHARSDRWARILFNPNGTAMNGYQ